LTSVTHITARLVSQPKTGGMSVRLLSMLGGLAFVAAACSSVLATERPAPEAAPDPRGGLAAELATPVPQPPDLVVPAADWRTDFGVADVPLGEIQASVPRDAIPSIDDPIFEPLSAAREWMDGRAPVIALDIDGDARAYPLSILLWHEIVNDEVGGRPVVVTFCPLCHASLVYDRILDGTERHFGNTGSLRFSDMVMYDRATESWWQQATGRAIIGGLTGAALEFLPSQVLSLNAFEAAYPEGTVLSRETGHERPYGDNPFLGYGDAEERPFRFDGAIDGRLAPKERVVTVGSPETEAIAFSYFDLAESGVAEETLEGQPIVVLWAPGTADSFDAPVIGLGDDIGSAGVFSPIVDGRELVFVRHDDDVRLRDLETDSTWSVTGRAIDGALEGTQLERVLHGDHFWFSWAAFTPETRVWQP
jgi:hypothetical protein